MAGKFYITTAIDYPNASPHIGTAYEKIGADAMARWKRLGGHEVYFLMGNDENSQKVVEKSVEPVVRRNEVVAVLEEGHEDISISRAKTAWGVPIPGDPDHVMYVWFDALVNYITGVGFPGGDFAKWWPADVHVIGKDITRFHCIIWPAMLMAAGVAPPRKVFAHGFVYLSGEKISKSGKRLDPGKLADRFGGDPVPYFLLREIPFDNDGDFSW